MAELSILDFGANPDGGSAGSAENDIAFANAIAALRATGGCIRIPHGVYHLRAPIVLRDARNVSLVGDGGNPGQPGTRLVYIGENPAGCLHLSTCIHAAFQSIGFITDTDAAEAVARIDAIENGPDAVSSLNNVFNACTFRAEPRAGRNPAGVRLMDTGHTDFRHCWFQAPRIAVRIGAPMRNPRPTISNGQCSNTGFDHCIFFADVVGERGTNVTFQNCEFAELKNGDGAKIDFGIGENPHVCNVTIRDCLAINGKSHRGAFFTQGRGGAGLMMTNTRIRGYAVGARIDGGGAAMLAANVFEQTSPGAIDIEITCAPESVSLASNRHEQTIRAGNKPVVLAS